LFDSMPPDDNPPNPFKADAESKLTLALHSSYAPQTDRNYGYAIKRFIKFAVSCGIPEHKALPCDPHILLLWLADGIGRTGDSVAQGNLSALAAWHKINGAPFEIPPQWSMIKRALKSKWPGSTNPKPLRKPITPAMIRMLVMAWYGGSPRQSCALALALAAWCGQMRLGELMPPSNQELDRSRLPDRKTWSRSSDGSSSIQLPWTKTKRFAGDTVYLLSHKPPLDPTTALAHHLATSIFPDSFLLCEFRSRSKGIALTMDKDLFMKLCNEVWSSNGLPHISGHSFRIGGTTSLLRAGVSPYIVKKMGRWSSDAYLRYWRDLKELFTDHAANIDWVDFTLD
jgi:hypothetical protein